jgi:DNA-binding NarL/FixJ family response regulator
VTIRVLIVADDPLARAGLAALLDGRPECAVAGQVALAEDLVSNVAVYRPDVLLWDLGWEPDLDLLPELDEIPSPVLFLLSDESYVPAAWSAGAQALLPRAIDAETLGAALRAVAQGLLVLEPRLAPAVLPAGQESLEPLAEELTPRELEVLQLLAEGLPNKTIAHRLGISDHTVKFHVNAILGKLGAQSRTDAVVRATRLGLILL